MIPFLILATLSVYMERLISAKNIIWLIERRDYNKVKFDGFR